MKHLTCSLIKKLQIMFLTATTLCYVFTYLWCMMINNSKSYVQQKIYNPTSARYLPYTSWVLSHTDKLYSRQGCYWDLCMSDMGDVSLWSHPVSKLSARKTKHKVEKYIDSHTISHLKAIQIFKYISACSLTLKLQAWYNIVQGVRWLPQKLKFLLF